MQVEWNTFRPSEWVVSQPCRVLIIAPPGLLEVDAVWKRYDQSLPGEFHVDGYPPRSFEGVTAWRWL